jgi:hypothetical protein
MYIVYCVAQNTQYSILNTQYGIHNKYFVFRIPYFVIAHLKF